MLKKIYDIVFTKLVVMLLPNLLKGERMVAFMQTYTSPINTLYLSFRNYRDAKSYQLAITSQVCYLEKLLNDRYDYDDRRIRIVDSIDKPPTYIYASAELKPVYLGTTIIYTEGESGIIKDDFIIKVPIAISFEDAEMLSLVKGYRLIGMKPKIQRI